MEMHELYREIENEIETIENEIKTIEKEIEKIEKEGSTVQPTSLISHCTGKLLKLTQNDER